MAKVWVKRVADYLVPVDQIDRDAIERFPEHDPIRIDVRRPRNSQWHRKHRALLNMLWDYYGIENYENFEAFKEALIIKAGFYRTVVRTKNGNVETVVIKADSTAFDDFDQDKFEKLYSKTIDIALESLNEHWSKEKIDNYVNNVMSYV